MFVFSFTIITATLLLLLVVIKFFKKQPHKVFLVDFACYKPPANQMRSKEQVTEIGKLYCNFSDDMLDNLRKGMDRAGLGDSTYFPEGLLRDPVNPCRADSRREMEKAMFGCIDTLLKKTSVSENIYKGNDHSMFIGNCIFRLGGAAILLSNRSSDRQSSKYQLIHTVNIQTAKSDRSYNCIFQKEDDDGEPGFAITKDLLIAASEAIKSNISILAPLILPLSEKIYFLANFIGSNKYKPNFSKAVNHFFPHVGGKPVLDVLQKNLGFSDGDMEASRMTLYRFGNTSSSSIWYELAYAEAKGRVKRGDYMWQIAFGSGFKCSSAVWRAIRSVDFEEMNPWSEEIDEFPLHSDQLGAVLESSLYHFEPPK